MSAAGSINPSVHPSRSRLWFGATAGAVAWLVHGFTCTEIAFQACKDGNGNWGVLGGPGVRLLLGGISLFLLAVTVTAGFISWRNWQARTEGQQLLSAEGLDREAYMALIGVILNIVFAVGIIWAGIPPIVIDVCVNYR